MTELAAEATGPLKGVKVLDMTSVVFGAYATQMLADLGAEVIKVEFPGGRRGKGGDTQRWVGKTPAGSEELGPIFMIINRNKRSVLLDIRKAEEKEALETLIADSDVFISSVRYAGLERLGLGYEAVRALRSDIVYAHCSAYGAEGPYAGQPAYDDLIQCASGVADLLSRTDGDPQPRFIPSLIGDKVSGLFGSQAVLAALFHRQKTGEGQFVEIPMLECLTSFNLVEHMFGHVYDPPTDQWAYHRVANPHRRPHPTKDGYVGVLPYTADHWERFFEIAGLTERAAADPKFGTEAGRVANPHALYALLSEVMRTKTTAEWLALLRPLNVPVVPLNRLDDLMTDEHLAAVGLFERYEHPTAGAYNTVRHPVRYAATPANIRRHPPKLGEHTAEVLAEINDNKKTTRTP